MDVHVHYTQKENIVCAILHVKTIMKALYYGHCDLANRQVRQVYRDVPCGTPVGQESKLSATQQ